MFADEMLARGISVPEAEYTKDYDEITKELICSLGLFLRDWEHGEDRETEALMERTAQRAAEDAAAFLQPQGQE